MKLNTIQDYPQTADIYNITNVDENTEQVFYGFKEKVRCKVVVKDRKSILLTDSQVLVGWLIQNVRDANGVELEPGYAFAVTDVNTVTNVFGYVEGKSYALSLTARQ
jgi:hypothetical protein